MNDIVIKFKKKCKDQRFMRHFLKSATYSVNGFEFRIKKIKKRSFDCNVVICLKGSTLSCGNINISYDAIEELVRQADELGLEKLEIIYAIDDAL